MIIKKRTRKVYTNEILWLEVVDGDTLNVIVDLGYNVLHKTCIRIHGIDAPELKKTGLLERIAANRVKDLIQSILDTAMAKGGIYAKSFEMIEHDGRGRTIGEIFIPIPNANIAIEYEHGDLLSALLLDFKVVRAYDGKTARTSWSDIELESVVKNCDKAVILLEQKGAK